MKSIIRLIIVGFVGMAVVPSANAAQLSCKYLHVIEQGFLHQHVMYNKLNNNLEARTVDQYIKRLDPTKMYLLKSDVTSLKSKMAGLFGKVQTGDCKQIDEVQKLLVTRVQERADFAKKTLEDKNFKFDSKTELVLDPDTRDFPKTKADADKFQLKYLQFQVSNQMATGTKQEEAQQQVIRSYERIVKRIKETKEEDLYANYLDSFGRALDPHSSFFSKDTLEDFEISMGLSLEGIGATLSSQDGFTVVEQLIPGGSAKESGLVKPQDKIIAVGQYKQTGETGEMENVVEMDLRDVVKKIRGPKGTKVRLTILRETASGKERLTVDLTREKIKLEDEAASLTFIDKEVKGEKKKIAVLNLPSFYADSKKGGRSSANDVKNLIKEAKEKAADGLVLDLSNNGGGSLDDAVRLAGLFFKTGAVVKQSARDEGQEESVLEDKDPAVDWDGPLAVLTSRISASASEIVAGTMKDYQRAVIVGGDHTFGKGSVQSVVPLPPGLGALKVTVGMFFTPGGFSTQHRGVDADVILPSAFSTDEIGEKSLDYSLPPKRIKSFLSADAYVDSGKGAWRKVEKDAVEVLKQRSQARVAKNEEFKKVTTELKKTKEKGKVIKLSEALKDTKEKKEEQDQKRNQTREDKVAEYLKRADVQEAANVVADLIEVQAGKGGKTPVTIGAKGSDKPVGEEEKKGTGM